jgi:hypothetical protein
LTTALAPTPATALPRSTALCHHPFVQRKSR